MKTRILFISIIAVLLVSQLALAGNIDATYKYTWSENIGWINWEPSHGGGVSVYQDHLEGYAWAENIGWVKMGTYTGGDTHTYANTDETNYGVNVDDGNLSGYAWSENAGWINFDPTHSQVTVDIVTGEFDGYAWGENIGWIHFKHADPEYNVKTTNTPLPVELTSFYATVIPNGIELHWETASEINNKGFYIYKNGVKTGNLIEGHGTTNEAHEYGYLDTNVVKGKLYTYQIEDIEEDTGLATRHPAIAVIAGQGMVENSDTPEKFALYNSYPNPFNPETTIKFDIPHSANISLKIYDAAGRLVRTFAAGETWSGGSYSVIWNGKNDMGDVVGSGTYFCKMVTEKYSEVKQLVLLK